MESLISDKNAMDPEVVVPDLGQTLPTVGRVLWVGLPHSWTLATFLVAGTSVTLWEPSTAVAGIIVAGLLACLRGKCMAIQPTGAGVWFSVLHHCCSLAAVGSCVRSTLQYMGGPKLRAWIVSHIAQSPNLFSTLVLAVITVFFILGLGRSRLLRSGLIGGIPATLSLLVLAGYLFYKPVLAHHLFQTKPYFKQVAESTAFFSLIFSGAVERSTVQKQLVLSSFAAVFVLALSSLTAVIFISIIVDKECFQSEVLLVSALEQCRTGVPGWDVRLLRDGLAITATLCLSLSLVEVMASAQRSLVSMAGHILPAAVARDNRWTGTQLLAILITGGVSTVLLCVSPLPSLLMLSSVSYLLSQSCDLLSAVYCRYQPLFVPKHSGEVCEGGGNYLLLSDTSRLMESQDSESELSDDSGHSSDTDIDGIVHEFRESIKVVAMTDSVVEPTMSTSRHATYSLVALLLVSVGLGASTVLGYTYMSLLGVIELVVFTLIISRQPQQLQLQPTHPLSPWHSCLTLSLSLVLAAQLISKVWLTLLAWTVVGIILWAYRQRRLWVSWQTALRRHADRARLRTAHHFTHPSPSTFLPTYRKMTHLDTVHIVR